MDLTGLLEKFAADYDVPGAAVAVLTQDGLTTGVAGVTNRRTGVAVDADTLFQIGSVTKVWTASMVLALRDQGRVDLDVPVRTYVPDLTLRDETVAATLTVRHLLNHTSGLPGDYFPDTGRGDDCLERYLAVLAEVELGPPLGELFSYSNAAFVLAGLVIERVTGETWDAALRNLLLEPLGLTRTVTLPEDALLHRAAVGHLGRGDEQQVAPTWVLPRNCGPAGLIVAAVGDVAEFGRMHLTGGLGRDGRRVLSEESVELMRQLTVAVPGGSQGRRGFGLGWGIGEWNGTTVLQHDGGTIGQNSALRVLPDKDAVLVLSANGGDWMGFRDAVFMEIAPAALEVTPPAPLRPDLTRRVADPTPYVGTYHNIGADVTVSCDDGDLLMTIQPLDDLEALAAAAPESVTLHPHEEDVFLAASPGSSVYAPVMFIRAADGHVTYAHVGGRAAARR